MGTSGKIYANAVAKYNEGKLLDAEKLRRISDAEYSDAIKMLYDYGYGEGIAIETADAVRLTDGETAKLLQFVSEYVDDENLYGFLLGAYLYNNLKASVKSRFTTVEESAYYPVFMDECEKVKAGVYDGLSANAQSALKKIDEIIEEGTISSRRIDEILTKAQYADELKFAKKLGKNAFKYAVYKIDCANLTTAMRCKKMGVKTADATEMYVTGGKISLDTFVEILSAEEDKLVSLVNEEYYDEIKELVTVGDLASFERNTDDRLFELIVRDRENMMTYDPLIGYFFAKKREIEGIKLILVCIKNGVQSEIRRRLRNIGE